MLLDANILLLFSKVCTKTLSVSKKVPVDQEPELCALKFSQLWKLDTILYWQKYSFTVFQDFVSSLLAMPMPADF